VRLADAFLHGRLYLLDNPSWLNELIPFAHGFYVVYPPLPAFLMTPLVAVFGLDLNQTLVSLFFGSFTVVLAYVVARDVSKNQTKEYKSNESTYLWAAALFGFSTIFWWLTSVGSVWLIAWL
jgi:predicted neutral ceramidase superfamily lipid hydrolase